MHPRRRDTLVAAMAALALPAWPAGAETVIDPLFDRLRPGISRATAVRILNGAGARIVKRQTDTGLARAGCPAGGDGCRRKLTFVSRVTAALRGRLYSLRLTSGLTGNRVWQVAVVAPLPAGLDAAAHRARLTKTLDQKPGGGAQIAIWRPEDVGWTLIVSWTGDRYTAVKRNLRLLRADRIARDRFARHQRQRKQ